MNVDTAGSPRDLVHAWAASGRVFAVAVGSLVALISLMSNAPLHVASFRGALAFVALRGLTSVGQWLVPRVSAPRAAAQGEAGGEGATSAEMTEAPGS